MKHTVRHTVSTPTISFLLALLTICCALMFPPTRFIAKSTAATRSIKAEPEGRLGAGVLTAERRSRRGVVQPLEQNSKQAVAATRSSSQSKSLIINSSAENLYASDATSDRSTNTIFDVKSLHNLFNIFGNSVATPAAPPASSLIANWKLDELSGTVINDATGNGSNGTNQGAAWTMGLTGAGALNFNGTDNSVSISSSTALTSVTNNFTLSFWAYPRSAHEIDGESASGYSGLSGQRYIFGPSWYDTGTGSARAGISVGTNGVSVYEHAAGYLPALPTTRSPRGARP